MNSYLKSNYSNLKIIINYYIVLLLLTMFAIYKNGIILYQKKLISVVEVFKPFIIILLALLIPYFISYLYNKIIKKKKYNLLYDYKPIYVSLIMLTLPSNLNIYFYILSIIVLSIIINLLNKNIINYYALYKIILICILILINKYSYLNLYNLNVEVNYSFIDLFLGRSIGGLATSNILIIIICYIIFSLTPYKKEIPIIASFSYFITLLIYSLLFKSDIILNIVNMFSGEFMYGVVFIASISHFSPISPKYRTIYAIFIGILSFIFSIIFNIYEGVFIAIIVSNIIIYLYKLIEGKK